MKRYERMSKGEIINVITGFAAQADGYNGSAKDALDALGAVLTREMKVKPRFMTIKSTEEMERELLVFTKMCVDMRSCKECAYYKPCHDATECFAKYLCEEVEVTE